MTDSCIETDRDRVRERERARKRVSGCEREGGREIKINAREINKES